MARMRLPREPQFLTEARARRLPEQVMFQDVEGTAPQVQGPGPRLAAGPPSGQAGPGGMHARAGRAGGPPVAGQGAPDAGSGAPPVTDEGPPAGAIEFAERVAAAVGAMRLTTERLAEQVRSDALEISILIARRIIETEITADIEPLFTVIRHVVRRAGESRRIVIHLCPEDAVRVEVAGGAKAMPGISAASVEVMPDQSLSIGDCVVEADFGVVDGRLNTRMEELRKILAEAIAGPTGENR
jgi:hypothetical protein